MAQLNWQNSTTARRVRNIIQDLSCFHIIEDEDGRDMHAYDMKLNLWFLSACPCSPRHPVGTSDSLRTPGQPKESCSFMAANFETASRQGDWKFRLPESCPINRTSSEIDAIVTLPIGYGHQVFVQLLLSFGPNLASAINRSETVSRHAEV